MVASYLDTISHYISLINFDKNPRGLYQPIEYILALGGKRIRPVMTLMAADAFGTSAEKALPAATAVEIFHNFSLVHDDIMDNAPLRRGFATVHEKWNTNTGILSGDAMLILAYQFFEHYEPKIFVQLAKLFSKTALEVCEGQQYDVEFETRNNVTIAEYIKMIEYKTAVLVGAAMKMGAIVAETSEENAQKIYDFGRLLGIAFQIQDDYLDAFGNPETFGKQVGGDIIENKKTFLYLQTLQLGDEAQQNQLIKWFENKIENNENKISLVKELFIQSGAKEKTINAIEKYTNDAFSVLNEIKIPQEKKDIFRNFGIALMNRNK